VRKACFGVVGAFRGDLRRALFHRIHPFIYQALTSPRLCFTHPRVSAIINPNDREHHPV
jgi:hypothetical protein